MEAGTSRKKDLPSDLQDVRLHLERKFPDQAPICLTNHRCQRRRKNQPLGGAKVYQSGIVN
jgi:hypothetical protein